MKCQKYLTYLTLSLLTACNFISYKETETVKKFSSNQEIYWIRTHKKNNREFVTLYLIENQKETIWFSNFENDKIVDQITSYHLNTKNNLESLTLTQLYNSISFKKRLEITPELQEKYASLISRL